MKPSTTAASSSTVVGVFPDRSRAEEAVRELRKVGFLDSQIGVVSQERDPARAGNEPSADRATNSKLAEGSALGAAAGAGTGALWALGIAAGMLPAVGWVVGGTLMAVLASAGGLATVGTIVGGLIGLGIPEEEAHYYEGEVKAGRTLVTVNADGRAAEVRSLFSRFGAYDHSTAPVAAASSQY
jgi:hypothetical protein